jgi:glucose-6-phosphate isomerase
MSLPRTANMDELPAHDRLVRLSAAPPDLTAAGVLTPERISAMTVDNASFRLLYGCQRVTPEIVDELQALAGQARVTEKFMAMKQGEVVNRIEGFESENRRVLHTACRDLFSDSPCHREASAAAAGELERLASFLRRLDEGELCGPDGAPFTTLVNIGIGGSDLGPRAVYRALSPFRLPGREVRFVANVDPDDAACVFEGLDLKHTLVNVVSKSGTTLETLTNEALVRGIFTGAGLDPKRHFLAVTGKGSPMDDPERYLASFHMFDYVGGRYSVTSMVGAVSLSFGLGIARFRAFLEGANRMDRAAENPSLRENIPLMMAMLGIWNRNYLGHCTLAVIPYSELLNLFPAHLQQCDMESNGKSVNVRGGTLAYATGPVLWGQAGTNGQHAFFQLLHQGATVAPVEFIGFRRNSCGLDRNIGGTTSREKLTANLLAQALALAAGRRDANPNKNFPGNRPSLILMADRLDPATMGELLAIYENKIVFQGFVWNINSFDQEGVQLGKRLATGILAAKSGRQAADPAAAALMEAAGLQ